MKTQDSEVKERKAATERGRRGALARARSLSARARSEIARKASLARWSARRERTDR